MHVAFGSPGHKGVTHLMAVGDYIVGEPVGPLGDVMSTLTQPTVPLWAVIAAGVAGYFLGKRRR